MFRRGPYDRPILMLAAPTFGALVAEPVYVLTDTAIVGHLGTDQLAGLAVAAAVLLSAHALLLFLAYGTTSLVGRLMGSGDHRAAARQGVQALWLALVLGALASVALGVWSGPLVDIFQPTAAVRDHALTYLRISLVGFTGLLVTLAGTGYLRGLHNTTTPLKVALISAVANLVLELVLVFGLDTGIAGSAWSTAIVQIGAGVVYARVILRAAKRHGASPLPDVAGLLASARVAAHLVIRTAALRGSLLVAATLAARRGTTDVAAHQVGMELWSLLALALDAVAIAGQALVARELGAGRVEPARQAGRRMIGMSIQLGALFAVLVLIGRPLLPHIFSDDPSVVALTGFVLLFVAAMQPLNGVVFALDGILIGAGDLAFLARAMVGAFVVFCGAGVALAATGAGIGWLWTAIAGLMVLRAAPLWVRFQQGQWAVPGADRRP